MTDSLADLLLVSEPAGIENLQREGHPHGSMHLVGNVMIDTLLWLLPQARSAGHACPSWTPARRQYGVVTLHRPANVDTAQTLSSLLDVLVETSRQLPLVFPIHPRTRRRIEEFGLACRASRRPARRLAAAGLSGFSGLDFAGRGDRDRLGRLAGGIDCAGNSVPDRTAQHRAADHGRGGHEHVGRQRPRSTAGLSSGRARRQVQARPLSGPLGRTAREANRETHRKPRPFSGSMTLPIRRHTALASGSARTMYSPIYQSKGNRK